MTTALVVGNMVGSGVFLLPASLGAYGGISLVGWLFTSLGALFLALTFSWLARALPRAGGPYAYVREAFGEFPAFLVAWGYWISLLGNSAIAVAGVGYLAFFVPALAEVPALAGLTAGVAVWVVWWINARGVHEAGGFQLATTVLKLVPLVAIGAYGLTVLHLPHFTPFNTSGETTWSAVSSTAALTMWAFLGLESATVPAGDIADADRTIPRATVLGTVVTAVIYIAGTVAVMGVIPPGTLARSTAPFADAARAMWGDWAAALVAAGAVISCFGALNGWTLLLGQLPRAAADDGLLPAVFGRLSARGTPAVGLAISSVAVTTLIAANYTRGLVGAFTFLILMGTVASILPYAASALALVRLEVRGGLVRAGRVTAALLGFGYALWMLASAGWEPNVWGAVLLVAGVPVYAWTTRRRRGASPTK